MDVAPTASATLACVVTYTSRRRLLLEISTVLERPTTDTS